MKLVTWIVCLVSLGHVVCREAPDFDGRAVARMSNPYINEASGVCASRRYPGVLYTHNDSGEKNRFFAISSASADLLTIINVANVSGLTTQDWEDIACGRCALGRGDCIYIADTGGNAGGVSNTIIMLPEPNIDPRQARGQELSLTPMSFLKFTWDQPDCETVMVDPTGDVYLVSKVDPRSPDHNKAMLVPLPKSAWGQSQRVNVTDDAILLNITISNRRGPVAGDISPNGHEVLVKTYGDVYYWYVHNLIYVESMTSLPKHLPYIGEIQGEGICFDFTGKNYYTLGEGENATLYLYTRRKSDPNGSPLTSYDVKITTIMCFVTIFMLTL